MRKVCKIFSLILLLSVFLVGCGKDVDSPENESEHITEITYNTFKEKLENKETFILEVVQTGCSNCSNFTPTLEKALEEYNLKALSINILNIPEADRNQFLDDYDIDGTPVVLFIRDGHETSSMKRIVGNQNFETVVSKLKTNGFIEE